MLQLFFGHFCTVRQLVNMQERSNGERKRNAGLENIYIPTFHIVPFCLTILFLHWAFTVWRTVRNNALPSYCEPMHLNWNRPTYVLRTYLITIIMNKVSFMPQTEPSFVTPLPVHPTIDKMDMPLLTKDIPKWLEWLKEDACQEWQAFLRDPLPIGTRECKLPKLVKMRRAVQPHESAAEETGSILQPRPFSEVSTNLPFRYIMRISCNRYDLTPHGITPCPYKMLE